jgi:hypothetical protein
VKSLSYSFRNHPLWLFDIPPPRLHKRSQLRSLHDPMTRRAANAQLEPSLSFPIAPVDIPHPARALYPRALAVHHSRDSTCSTTGYRRSRTLLLTLHYVFLVVRMLPFSCSTSISLRRYMASPDGGPNFVPAHHSQMKTWKNTASW